MNNENIMNQGANNYNNYPSNNPSNKNQNKKFYLAIALVALITALLTGVIVWLVQQNKISELEKDVESLQSEIDELEAQSGGSMDLPEDTERAPKDRIRESDINSIRSQLEFYYGQEGHYPSLENMNDSGWVANNLQGLEIEALQDPDGDSPQLVSSPQENAYAYEVSPSNCDNRTSDTQCTDYVLTAVLDDEDPFVRESLY